MTVKVEYTDENGNIITEDFHRVKTYEVLESHCIDNAKGFSRIFVLKNIENGARQLIKFDQDSKVWGDAKTVVAGDTINITWLISPTSLKSDIIDIKVV